MSAEWLDGLTVGLIFGLPIGLIVSRIIDHFERRGRHDRWV